MIQYSEIFRSIQGEGVLTGNPTIWLRYFSCNLQCNGFGQDDPTDPGTYDLPYEKIDLTDITHIEDLPVFTKGCDSSYSWSKKFKHLQKKLTVEEVVDQFESLLPNGVFSDKFDLCFTGGEPLLKRNQKQTVEILKELQKRNNLPNSITFETNGTQPLTRELSDILGELAIDVDVFMSISPKLFTVSGEDPRKAIKPEVMAEMYEMFPLTTYLKFVCDMNPKSWEQVKEVCWEINCLYGCDVTSATTWIMPVGATKESQEDISAQVADKAISLGYKVSARVHCAIWGNQIGT